MQLNIRLQVFYKCLNAGVNNPEGDPKVTKYLYASLGIIIAATTASIPAHAYDLGEYGKVLADLRYRYEYVNQEGLDRTAQANTVRARVGYQTPVLDGLSGYLEGETIQHLGYARFNDSINGHTKYPSVSDPEDNAINQAYVNYDYQKLASFRVGRQAIEFDNSRFIGHANWRQNDPTFDAATVTVRPIDKLELAYVYSWNFNRNLGNRSPYGEYETATNLLHAQYAWPQDIKTSAYYYSMDMKDSVDAAQSNTTYGARVEWKPKWEGVSPIAAAELAHQSDAGDNPRSYSELYQYYEGGMSYMKYKASLAFEQFGSNGDGAVITPFGSGHGFNGWTDKFSTMPRTGLRDQKVLLSGPIPYTSPDKFEWAAQLHDFNSTTDSIHYGQEAGISVTYKPFKDQAITAKTSRYDADERFRDTTKAWLQYDVKF